MKKILFSLFLLFAAFALRSQNGYWEEAKGPYGGEGNLFMALNGKLIYNTFVGGIQTYVSYDDGLNWNRIPNMVIDSSATGNFAVQAGNGGNFYKTLKYPDGSLRVFRSSDDAETWNYAFSADTILKFVETPNGTLIGANGTRLLRSTNGGQHWNVVYKADSLNAIGSLQIGNNGNIWAYCGGDSLLRSQNNGQTWSKIWVSTNGDIHITNNGTIIISNAGGLYRTSNNGVSYQNFVIDTSTSAQRGTFCTLSTGRVLYSGFSSAGTQKLFYSDNNGITWLPLGASSKVTKLANVRLLDGTIFCNRVRGLYRSNDGGVSWQFSSKGIRAYQAKLLFVSTDTIYAGINGNLQRTFDAGNNWEKISNDSCERGKIFALYEREKLVFMLNEKLFLSEDGGNTQIDITPPVQIDVQNYTHGNSDFIMTVNPISKTFIVSNPLKSFRSVDKGQTWNEIPNLKYLRDIQFQPDGTIYAISNEGFKKSMDDGINWEPVSITAINLCITKAGNVFIANLDGIFKWDANALEWIRKGSLIDFFNFESSSIISNNQGFLFRFNKSNAQIFMSVNEGETWQTLPSISSLFNFEYSLSVYSTYLEIGSDQHLYFTTPAGMFRSSKSTLEGAFLRGNLFRDEDADCLTYETMGPLKNWIVKAENGFETFTTTDQNGGYVMLLDTGIYDVSISPINGIWWNLCDTSQTIALDLLGASDTANFSALPLANCPLISVNVAAPQLRRCFDNQVYVEYCNQGTEPADSAWVDIMLDPYLSMVNSAQPHEDLGGNTIRFLVGDLPSGDCGQFQLTVHVDCDSTVLGQTHCVTAHGFPDTLCTTVPTWSGANIEASVSCGDTTLQFHLKNTGTAHSQLLDYIIIEDDIVLFSGQAEYDIAEDVVLDYPANGKTWRIESEQEPGHPFSNLALAFTEGCGGFNSLGYINQFTVNGIQPSWHRMCVENTGSFDPNDKQGFPIGTGDEHNIRPGQTIDYLIRFQNTGTDTAFTVLIRDTLSAFLDPLSIRPGASSHPYTWDLSGQGVITFRFNNIMLPDSNVNEAASHGFVQFSIAPYLNVPLGSVIKNSAAIYFDFNEPVITNTTWHTIEKSPLSSAINLEPTTSSAGLEVWPNPFSERTNIHLEQKTSGMVYLKIYDSQGSLVTQKSALSSDIEVNTKNLPVGLYWAEVRDGHGRLLGNGKLVKE